MAKKLIGEPLDRIDGKLKVTGRARYSADMNPPGMVHAVLIMSTVGSGRIQEMDTTAAEKVPGVISIITHKNAQKPAGIKNNKPGETALSRVLNLLQDDVVHYNNQPIGMAIADTFEHAGEAAVLVRVKYREKDPSGNCPSGSTGRINPKNSCGPMTP